MTAIAANQPAYDGKVLDLTGKSGARAFKNTLATVLIVLAFAGRDDPAGLDPVHRGQQGLPPAAGRRTGGASRSAASPSGGTAAARTTRSWAR